MDDTKLEAVADGLFGLITDVVAESHDPDEDMGAYLADLWDVLERGRAAAERDDPPGPIERDLLDRAGFGDHPTC